LKKCSKIYLYLFLCLILFPYYIALCDSTSDFEMNLKKAFEISKSINDEINTYLKIKNSEDKISTDIKEVGRLNKSIKKNDETNKNKDVEKVSKLSERTSVETQNIFQYDEINTDQLNSDIKKSEKSTINKINENISVIINYDVNASSILNLNQTMEKVIEASLKIKSAEEEVKAAKALFFSQKTKFLPSVSGSYKYTYNDEARVGENLKEESSLSATVSQPIFNGFLLKSQYKMADYALKIAELKAQLIKEEVILDAKEKYFAILKAEKLYSVAKNTVEQITSHKNVAENFYRVGMVPLNDFLKAEVRLANAMQMLLNAKNNFEIAIVAFNTLLRRSENTPVVLKDVEDYIPFDHKFDYCFKNAGKKRIELRIADISIKIAESAVKLSEGGFFPHVAINGNYYKIGEDWNTRQIIGIDPNRWEVTALASWELFDWGGTYFERKGKKHYVNIAKNEKEELIDHILIEVKSYFLRVKEAEVNIKASRKAVEQAKENFRINKEQYKEQMATSTDVLDAQTLLTETMTNYYNSLYNFSISKSRLKKAMGL